MLAISRHDTIRELCVVCEGSWFRIPNQLRVDVLRGGLQCDIACAMLASDFPVSIFRPVRHVALEQDQDGDILYEWLDLVAIIAVY